MPAGAAPFRILVLCTGNSARSQIAEALLATRGQGRVEAVSAGSAPAARVNPGAVEVLREHGIAWEGKSPKSIDDVAGQPFDLVLTVCDNARDACPFFPGARVQVHWGMPDPAAVDEPRERQQAFRATYDALDTWITRLLELPLETLEPGDLKGAAQSIIAS